MLKNGEKHKQELPSARKVRRSCNKELYRTIKKLNKWIPPEKVAEAERLYFTKVVPNLLWIAENGSNRRKLADWWADHVAPELATLWDVEPERLVKAFRDSFGG
jgi:hypothetical protein